MNYIDYLTDCFQELDKIQNKLFQTYDINSYTKWDYDQACGILTLSKPDKIINFRYYVVGTYSKKENTWKWSWDNHKMHKKVKIDSEKIRDFGLKNNYETLINGEFDSYEEIGWELSSICINLIGGIGVYRPFFEQLNIHLILTEFIENDIADEEKSKYIDCENHYRRRIAYVCQHLSEDSKIGFEESFETYEDMEFEYEDDDFMAWCNNCEKIREREGGFNETSWEYSNFKIVCEKCYFLMKESNLLYP